MAPCLFCWCIRQRRQHSVRPALSILNVPSTYHPPSAYPRRQPSGVGRGYGQVRVRSSLGGKFPSLSDACSRRLHRYEHKQQHMRWEVIAGNDHLAKRLLHGQSDPNVCGEVWEDITCLRVYCSLGSDGCVIMIHCCCLTYSPPSLSFLRARG